MEIATGSKAATETLAQPGTSVAPASRSGDPSSRAPGLAAEFCNGRSLRV